VPVTLQLEVTDRVRGVPPTTSVVPPAPTLTPTAGQNQLQISWAVPSGVGGQELVEIWVQAETTPDRVSGLTVSWGDGSPTEVYGGFGRKINRKFTHVYTSATPVTIEISISLVEVEDIVFNETLALTPNPSEDLDVDQIQIETYEDGVLIFQPDWRAISLVPTTFITDEVRRGYTYKARIRARKSSTLDRLAVETQFSDITTQEPWA
jgi:hypothetical protein